MENNLIAQVLANTQNTQDIDTSNAVTSYASWFWILLAAGICVGYLVKKKS